MALEVEATYERGLLKLDKPLPFADHERVVVQVKPKVSRIRQSAGLFQWCGDPAVLRKIAEDPEYGAIESP